MIWDKVKDIDGWLTQKEAEQLYKFAQQAEFAVEIGSWKGKSSICLAEGVKQALVCVDTFKGSPGEHEEGTDTYEEFRKNTEPWRNKIDVLKLKSEDAAKNSIFNCQLLFIDGAHNEEDVRTDVKCWTPFLEKGGILIMHDVFWVDKKLLENKYPAVRKVFDELIASGNWEFVEMADRSGVLRKL
jgi:predicted O-methyltransferase YrrM